MSWNEFLKCIGVPEHRCTFNKRRKQFVQALVDGRIDWDKDLKEPDTSVEVEHCFRIKETSGQWTRVWKHQDGFRKAWDGQTPKSVNCNTSKMEDVCKGLGLFKEGYAVSIGDPSCVDLREECWTTAKQKQHKVPEKLKENLRGHNDHVITQAVDSWRKKMLRPALTEELLSGGGNARGNAVPGIPPRAGKGNSEDSAEFADERDHRQSSAVRRKGERKQTKKMQPLIKNRICVRAGRCWSITLLVFCRNSRGALY